MGLPKEKGTFTETVCDRSDLFGPNALNLQLSQGDECLHLVRGDCPKQVTSSAVNPFLRYYSRRDDPYETSTPASIQASRGVWSLSRHLRDGYFNDNHSTYSVHNTPENSHGQKTRTLRIGTVLCPKRTRGFSAGEVYRAVRVVCAASPYINSGSNALEQSNGSTTSFVPKQLN